MDTDPDCDKDMDVNTMTEIKTCAESHQDFEFEETVVHPAYDQYLKVNDIALVRLAREVNLTSQGMFTCDLRRVLTGVKLNILRG